MRCPGSDRHSCHTATSLVELDGPKVIVKVRGPTQSCLVGLRVKGSLGVGMAYGSLGVNGDSHRG